jgi:hypothetical protein
MARFDYSTHTAMDPDVFEKAWNEFVSELYRAGLEPPDDEPVFVAPGLGRTYEYYKIQPIETDADDDGTAQAPRNLETGTRYSSTLRGE